MKKLIIKATLVVIVALGLSNYGLYLTTGKSPLSEFSFNLPFTSSSFQDLKPELPLANDTAYKWTDENGVVHYSTEPPANVAKAERIEVDPNTNLIQGVEVPQPETSAPESAQEPTLSNPYSAKGIQETLDKARNVQKILDERHEKQKKLMGD